MSKISLKNIGYDWESVVLEYYKDMWYTLLLQNYTIADGEIDLIFDLENTILFVEVKVIDHTDDIYNYVSPKKLHTLRHTIEVYCHRNNIVGRDLQLDVVFVKKWTIVERYEAIEM